MSTVLVKRIHFHAEPGPYDFIEVKFNYGSGAEEIGLVLTLQQAAAIHDGIGTALFSDRPNYQHGTKP